MQTAADAGKQRTRVQHPCSGSSSTSVARSSVVGFALDIKNRIEGECSVVAKKVWKKLVNKEDDGGKG